MFDSTDSIALHILTQPDKVHKSGPVFKQGGDNKVGI